MLKSLFVLSTISLFSFGHAAEHCQNNDQLLAGGFIQHPTHQFSKIYQKLSDRLKNEKTFKEDIKTEFDSPYLEKRIEFQDWDNTTTPEMEMFGDIAFYKDAETHAPIELRWYENQQKHFVMIAKGCSADDAPLADNTLF